MKAEHKILIGSVLGVGLLFIFSRTHTGKSGGLNNPGNLRTSGDKFLGETSKPGDAFKSFVDVPHGTRAMFVILNTYRSKYGLKTLAELISRYAPSSENDTAGYIDFVAKQTGVKPDAIISTPFLPYVVAAMSKMEGRRPLTISEAKQVYEKFFA